MYIAKPFNLALKPLTFAVLTGITTSFSPALQADVIIDATPSSAVQQSRAYAIAADSLSRVLNQFAEEAGVLISFDTTLLQNQKSAGLKGEYTVRQALNKLLDGQQIDAHISGNSITLTAAQGRSRAQGVALLNPVLVEARDPDNHAASVYVADAEMENARMGDLKDLFAGVASVSVGGAIPVAQKMYVNGIDMLNLAISVDGVSHNNRVFHHVSANAFDPGLMKFVRIDPGVATADAGPNALAGAVVMETVDADDLLADGDNFGGNVRLSYEDNGSTFGGAVTAAMRNDSGLEGLFYGKRMTGDDYEDGAGSAIRGTAASLKSGLAKLAYESPEGHRVELSAQTMVDDADRRYRANFGTLLGRQRPGQTETRVHNTERNSYALSYHNTMADGLFDPAVTLGYSENVVGLPTSNNVLGNTSTVSGTFKNTFHLSDTDNIVAGVDFYDRKSEIETATSAPLNEKAKNVGLFVQGRVQPAERWQLSLGGRADRQRFTGQNGYTDRVSGLSANSTLTYEVTEGLSARAGYSTVFGGIPVEDNYLFENGWDYNNLKDTNAENFNVGLDFERGNLTLSGELFKTRIDDIRNRVDNDDVEARGFNLGATYGWENGFARMTLSKSKVHVNGQLGGSYTLLDYGTPLGTIIALQAQQELPGQNLLLGATLDIALDYDEAATTQYGNQVIPGHEVANLYAEYQPAALDGLKIRAEVKNLFDKLYADQATYGGDYNGIVTLKEPGRTFALAITKQF